MEKRDHVAALSNELAAIDHANRTITPFSIFVLSILFELTVVRDQLCRVNMTFFFLFVKSKFYCQTMLLNAYLLSKKISIYLLYNTFDYSSLCRT